MDDQRVVVPNLQEMDEQEAHRFLAELLSNLDPQEEYNARHHEDYVMEMPQSGEGFRGRENLRTMQEAYPTTTPPSVGCAGCWLGRGYGSPRGRSTTVRGGRSTWC
jgi:hypothetical protein